MKKYDYLIVGSGLFGSILAHELNKAGYKVLVIEKRDHVGGNIYTKKIEGIDVHYYGAHIFHTSNKRVWDYVNSIEEFTPFINSPIANYKGELYNLPFNMNTFIKMFDNVHSVDDAKKAIQKEIDEANIKEIKNLEDQAISLAGKTIFTKLIKGYTEKQWGRDSKDLPSFIIRRIPLRFTFDNNYFNDVYQGIPRYGYTDFIENLLSKVEVRVSTDFFENEEFFKNLAEKIIYTGPLDQFFHYSLGRLSYRSIRFETKILDKKDYQGVAVMNFTDRETPYTRVIEHKHFDRFNTSDKTVISFEYSSESGVDSEPYYPVNDERNNSLADKYRELAKSEPNVIFGGRLANYQYLDMDDVVELALNLVDKLLNE